MHVAVLEGCLIDLTEPLCISDIWGQMKSHTNGFSNFQRCSVHASDQFTGATATLKTS